MSRPILTLVDADEDWIGRRRKRQGITKRLSRAFGNKQARQNQLVARLKRKRGYAKPVPGGTGKQRRTKKKTFAKHYPGGQDHDQSKHGKRGKAASYGAPPLDEYAFDELHLTDILYQADLDPWDAVAAIVNDPAGFYVNNEETINRIFFDDYGEETYPELSANLRNNIVEQSQWSLKERGLSDEFIVFRSGPVDASKRHGVSVSLSEGIARRGASHGYFGGEGTSLAAYSVKRSDVLADMEFVLENTTNSFLEDTIGELIVPQNKLTHVKELPYKTMSKDEWEKLSTKEKFTKHYPGGQDHDQSKHGDRGKITPLGGDHPQRDTYYRFEMGDKVYSMGGQVGNSLGTVYVRSWDMDDKSIGFLYWDRPTGIISDVFVEKAYRRKGIATAMLKMARGLDPNVKHSTALSDEGRGWSEVAKHLPGRHDQMTHGRRKTSGPVRGTSARDGPRRDGKRVELAYPEVPSNVGNCYEVAGRFMLNDLNGEDEATLVHGVIRNLFGGDVAHGWVELSDGFIYEPTTDAVYHPDDFERLVNPLTIIEYPGTMALATMAETGHWGPYDEVSEDWYEAYHYFRPASSHVEASHDATETIIYEHELWD